MLTGNFKYVAYVNMVSHTCVQQRTLSESYCSVSQGEDSKNMLQSELGGRGFEVSCCLVLI